MLVAESKVGPAFPSYDEYGLAGELWLAKGVLYN